MTHDSTITNNDEIVFDAETNTYTVPAETMKAIRDGYRSLDLVAEDILNSPYLGMMGVATVEQFKNLTQTNNPVAREVIVAVAMAGNE